MSFGNEYITHLEAVGEQLRKLRAQLKTEVTQLNSEEMLQEISEHINQQAFKDNPQSLTSIQAHLKNIFFSQKPLLRGNNQAFYHFLEDQIMMLRFRKYVKQHFIEAYSSTFTEGYCTALPMLVLEKMNHPLVFWPSDTEVLANPMKLVQHFQKKTPWLVSETTSSSSLSLLLERIYPKPGLLVVVDMAQYQGRPSQKNGQKHLLIYRGKQKTTHQAEFISFDQDRLHLTLTHHQSGYLINLPALFPQVHHTAVKHLLTNTEFIKQRC